MSELDVAAELRAIREALQQERLPQLLSKRAAARVLGISAWRTLEPLIASGRIRTVTVNGRVRIPLVEVQRVAAEGTEPTPQRKRRAAPKEQVTTRRPSPEEMNARLKAMGF